MRTSSNEGEDEKENRTVVYLVHHRNKSKVQHLSQRPHLAVYQKRGQVVLLQLLSYLYEEEKLNTNESGD